MNRTQGSAALYLGYFVLSLRENVLQSDHWGGQPKSSATPQRLANEPYEFQRLLFRSADDAEDALPARETFYLG